MSSGISDDQVLRELGKVYDAVDEVKSEVSDVNEHLNKLNGQVAENVEKHNERAERLERHEQVINVIEKIYWAIKWPGGIIAILLVSSIYPDLTRIILKLWTLIFGL